MRLILLKISIWLIKSPEICLSSTILLEKMSEKHFSPLWNRMTLSNLSDDDNKSSEKRSPRVILLWSFFLAGIAALNCQFLKHSRKYARDNIFMNKSKKKKNFIFFDHLSIIVFIISISACNTNSLCYFSDKCSENRVFSW